MTETAIDARLRYGDLVISDFDGTISAEDTGLLVFNALQLAEPWESEWRWRRGEMSSMQCLAEQWGYVKLSVEELYALIDTFKIDRSFGELRELCAQVCAGFVIVSDGLDFYLDRMLLRLGCAPCAGERVLDASVRAGGRTAQAPCPLPDCVPRFVNHAEVSDHTVTVSFPYEADECKQCGNCKSRDLFGLRPHFNRVFYLGDGFSDMCAARFADVIFAKDHLLEYCRSERIPHIPFANLGDVVAAMGGV